MSVEEDTAEDQDGDFDAQCLLGRWWGSKTVRRAVREVRSDHAVEEEEGHVAAPCCNDERPGEFNFEFRPIVTTSSSMMEEAADVARGE